LFNSDQDRTIKKIVGQSELDVNLLFFSFIIVTFLKDQFLKIREEEEEKKGST